MPGSKPKIEKQMITAIVSLDTVCAFEDIFYTLASMGKFKYISFLDSSLVPNRFSNYSYLAWEPEFVIKSSGVKNEIRNLQTGSKEVSTGHPLKFLEQLLKNKTFVSTENIFLDNSSSKIMPPEYKGGFIGYFSYELKDYIEKLQSKAKKDIKVPVFYLSYYLKFLAFNHHSGKCYFIKNYMATDCADIRKDMLLEKQNISRLLECLQSGCRQKVNNLIIKKYRAKQISDPELISNFSKPDYIMAITKTREHIHNGDIYQANISQRFSCNIDVDPVDLYYMLRQKNSAPFCAFLSFPGLKIGCSSPERFIFLKEGKVETRPIKGTRPRGRTLEEDNSFIKELRESEKDHAELNMIVDLERNDLGRFCKYGTVKVKEHAVVEKYAKVFHLVSTVTGLLQEGYSHIDIIKSVFPGGSITGAPKIRAMEIIDSLEPTARNIYTGSIGYISLDGTMDLNIAIRTFVIKKKKFYYNVGGGIVEDSIPESEYQETLDKGLALKETLEFFLQKNLEAI
jgi:para-aminobenzoate synthetase component I